MIEIHPPRNCFGDLCKQPMRNNNIPTHVQILINDWQFLVLYYLFLLLKIVFRPLYHAPFFVSASCHTCVCHVISERAVKCHVTITTMRQVCRAIVAAIHCWNRLRVGKCETSLETLSPNLARRCLPSTNFFLSSPLYAP